MGQFIVSIGREFGSGGHEVAEILAKRFDIKLYDRNILTDIAEEKGTSVENLAKFEEKPRNVLFSRNVSGYSSSMETAVADMETEYIKRKAESGESFIVVGRCSDEILDGLDINVISLFVTADDDKRIERIAKEENVDTDKAEKIMKAGDRRRKSFHDLICKSDWGEADSYDLCINSSKAGIEKTVDIVEAYIKSRI